MSLLSSSSKLANLADRMKVLLSTANGADIHFLVGEEKKLFRAHKHILTLSSDAFEAMFCYDTKNAKSEAELSNPVEVPDVEAAAFKVMLSFIYADDFSGLNGDNAMAVLYAAKKYCVDGLIGRCLQKIPIPKLPNVFLAYAQARLLGLEDFALQCLRYIDQNAGPLFESNQFLQIDQNLLCELFDRDQLVLNTEFKIWKAALRWADEKCRQIGFECFAENRRSVLGPALFKIRFPYIPTLEFSRNIVPSGVLTIEEIFGVYQFLCHPNFRGVPGLNPLKFPWNGRISDWNKANGNRGTLAMEIEKLSEFADEEVGSKRFSDYEIRINGFGWKILAEIRTKSTEKCLGFYLCCTAPKEDANWRSKCSATLRILSQKHGTEDLIGKFNDHITKTKNGVQGFANFIAFSELMDPSRGLYDQNKDKVTLVIDAIVEEQIVERFIISNPIKSNGTIEMEIDKLSEFAREICRSERSSETVHIMGCQWKILAEIITKNESNEKWLAFFLKCAHQIEDENWSRKCMATLRIVSQLSWLEDFSREFDEKRIFSAGTKYRGFTYFITFAELMDPSRGFYDKNEDKVTLAIDFSVEGDEFG
ncbi:hypothetical protein niasHS_004514 [Heterodera schachtii]|uniref:BTB domain-containing protein n=1 Tax=Heterodera schachtii TaxID=97005 RepID=A0ABD2JMH6_HETSC